MTKTVRQLSALIQDGSLTSRELVEAALQKGAESSSVFRLSYQPLRWTLLLVASSASTQTDEAEKASVPDSKRTAGVAATVKRRGELFMICYY